MLQGCLSLISSGTGGFKVLLLGTAEEGRDVFFTTTAQLVPQDNDTAEDIYDARIGGGFPVPVSPTECEGDACSTPLAAPIDSTPASLTFSGPGNPAPATIQVSKAKAKPKKATAKKKARSKKRKRKGKARSKGNARKSVDRRAG